MRRLLPVVGIVFLFGTCGEGTQPVSAITGYFGVGFVAGTAIQAESLKMEVDFGIEGAGFTFYRCDVYPDTIEFHPEDSANVVLKKDTISVALHHTTSGIYLPDTLPFSINPEDSFTLSIEIGERERTISVVLPSDFTISLPDSVSLNDTVEIKWGTITNAVNVEVKAGNFDTIVNGNSKYVRVPVALISNTAGYTYVIVNAINGPEIPVENLEGYTPSIDELENAREDIITGIFSRFIGIYSKAGILKIY